MNAIKQLTVYADVRDAQLLHHLSTVATSLCESVTIHTIPDADAANPLAFLHFWEKEKEDVWSYVKNDVPIMHRLECFVTDSKNRSTGVVAYALYYRKIPVLSLLDLGESAEGMEADWLVNALYFTAPRLCCTSAVDAVNSFFTFPAAAGKVIAVEGEGATLVAVQCRLLCGHMRREWNMPVQLVGASGCDLADTDAASEDEEELSLYASLCDSLLKNPELQTIREEDPQLQGALYALNRHHNLTVLRYRLQRGINVVVCRPMSCALAEFVKSCERRGIGTSDSQEALTRVVKSLLQFEERWLGLPTADVVLFRGKHDHAAVVGADGGVGGPSARWASWLWGEGTGPVIDALSNWRAVEVEDAGDDARQFESLHGGLCAAVQSFLS
ncbi:hypothetical protein DQ04_00341090 [Trypanosoma grayi]|uniref:hypothetical protein n=1 Tax=Trypanosoma grayi TaxID=71804 RepID=UPI0004F471C1|nr:hypothetical protein DQ04_00341090 [Trypanosoma grayi]KEG14694.1 hypothetical protein DQ04_00341090 [Trypanosoma grayi]